MPGDFIDRVIAEWNRELPELDTRGLAVGGRVLVITKHLEKRVDRLLEPYGVQIWGFDVLAALRRSSPPYVLTPKQLMAACFLTSGAVTNRVNRLETAGLVTRSNDTEDRRSVRVALTPAGHKLVELAILRRVQEMQEVYSVFDEGEQETLARLLRKLLLRFEQLDEPS